MTATESVDAPPPAGRITPRRVRFDWAGTPLHWVPGDAQTTHTANVLHLLLPAGEQWFVHLYRQALPLVTDARLRDEVKGFMGQEARAGGRGRPGRGLAGEVRLREPGAGPPS